MNEKRPGATGEQLQLWFYMLEQGGRWKATELMEEVPTVAGTPRLLAAMVRSGQVHQYKTGARSREYGVTNDCRLPQGVTLKQLSGALGRADQ